MWNLPLRVGSKESSFLRESRDSSPSMLVLELIRKYRSAYYILYLLFPFPTRTNEEDKANWAIVGHEADSPSSSNAPSQDGATEKAVQPV